MANEEHLKLLRKGVRYWNPWRMEEPPDSRGYQANLGGVYTRPVDLSEADLSYAGLINADLSFANLAGADLSNSQLYEANLSRAKLLGANLSKARLDEADLKEANLLGANLSKAHLGDADLRRASLIRADLSEANLREADLRAADLREAVLRRADLREANLYRADLSEADLSEALLNGATLLETNLTNAVLTGCRIYGISAWNVKLEGAQQRNLIITSEDEPEVTTDDLEVAQFIYLLLSNEKLLRVVDTITSKVVLILGRFSPERKAVLDALRDELRTRNYVPVVFDFEKPRSGTTVNTITLLARMARFVIADISDAKSVLMELQAIVPHSPKLPVQPIVVAGQTEPGMFDSFEAYPWFLEVHPYENPTQLLVDIQDRVIGPLETEVARLRT
jgi:uncharacterized protein YjbI with pentapeptide repeats